MSSDHVFRLTSRKIIKSDNSAYSGSCGNNPEFIIRLNDVSKIELILISVIIIVSYKRIGEVKVNSKMKGRLE